jgi:hypothetical protein
MNIKSNVLPFKTSIVFTLEITYYMIGYLYVEPIASGNI